MNLVQDSADAKGLGDAGKRVMEQYELESEIKKREKATAGAGKAAQAKLMETYGGVLSKPYEEFKPSQESLGGFAALGSLLMVAGAMMGGKGRLSGIGAMNNIAGMMKGYQEGRKDLYEQERKQFEENMKTFEKNRGMIKEAFDRALKIAPTNLKLANDMLRRDLQALGASVPAEMVGKSGAVQAAGSYQTFSQNTDKTLEQLKAQLSRSKAIAAAEEADIKAKKTAKELAGTGAPIKIQYEGKTVYADRTGKPLKDENDQVIEAPPTGRGGATSALLAGRADNVKEAFVQAAADLKNIKRFPRESTVLGAYSGMAGKTGDSLVSGLKNTFARTITPTESRMFQQLVSGLEANLAMALGGGYAASAAKYRIDMYKTQIPQAGDNGYVVATFLARVKQELNLLAENFPSKPGATPDMIKKVEEANDTINDAIPFNVQDVTDAYFAGQAAPGATPQTDSGDSSQPSQGDENAAYTTIEDVTAAYNAGEIDREKAKKILREKFKVQ